MKDMGIATSPHIKIIQVIVQQKWLIFSLVILFCGLVLIAYSNIIQNSFISRFIESIGIGLLPIGSFLLIYEFGMRKEYQNMVRQEFDDSLKDLTARCGECEKYGLIALNATRESDRIIVPFETSKYGDTISVLGVALADLTYFDTHEKVIESIKRGCKVRLLYLAPDSDEAERHSLDEGRGKYEVKQHIKGTEGTWQKDIDDPLLNNLEVRMYRSQPKHFILIHKNGVYVGNYLNGHRGNRCPHFLFQVNSPIAEEYIYHFEELWGHSNRIK